MKWEGFLLPRNGPCLLKYMLHHTTLRGEFYTLSRAVGLGTSVRESLRVGGQPFISGALIQPHSLKTIRYNKQVWEQLKYRY